MSQPSASAGTSVDLLLILRGLAAISVVVWHLEGYKALMPHVVNTPGRTAVWLFFGISGYVIAYGFVHRKYRMAWPDLGHFYVNRALRIYPLFLFLSLLALVTAWFKTGSSPLTIADIPAQFFGVQWNQKYILSGVFWTLGIELQFYLIAPLLALPLLVRNRAAILMLAALYAALVYGFWYAVANHGWSHDGRNIISNLPHFFIGMIACWLVAGGRLPIPAWMSLPAALALLGYTNWLYHTAPTRYWSLGGMLLVDGAILCFVLAHHRLSMTPAPRNVVYRTFTFLGVLAYGIYAWHAYFPQIAPKVLEHVSLLIAISVAASYVSYRLLEQPALRLKRYSAHARTAARPESVTPPQP